MKIEDVTIGHRVVVKQPGHPLNYKKATVIDIENSDDVVIRFDVLEPWFQDTDSHALRGGIHTISPEFIEELS